MNRPHDQENPSTPPADGPDADIRPIRDEAVEQWNQDSATEQAESADEMIRRLRSELEDANRRVLVAHAETENIRKRMRRDYEDQLKYASMPLIRDILEVLDNLRRAIAAAKSAEAAAGLTEGVAMVAKQLEEVIQKHQCRPIPAAGELFDPNYHEAISQVPSDEHPAGVVAHEAVVGYQLHDRVVRPSQVVVSSGPAANPNHGS